MNRLSFIFLSLSLFLLPQSVFGQMAGLTPNYSDELTINLSPQYPAPGDKVSVSLEMYSENLNTASISWYQDGKLVARGTGVKYYSFSAPQAGKETVINLRITTENGVTFSKAVTIRPATVDILWEGNSYVPPFYKGRSLWAAQGDIQLVALPTFGNPSKLVYTWKINNQVSDQSGYGNNSISLSNNGLSGNIEVNLLVTDPVTNVAAQTYLTIPQTQPSIVFYEDNPLYGIIFDRAVTSVNLDKSEMSVLAAPFNLFIGQPTDIDYQWKMNGSKTDSFGRTITLRKPEEGSGRSNISLTVNNRDKVMQFAEDSFLVKFK